MKIIFTIISFGIILLCAFGIGAIFNIDWKWLFVVLYTVNFLLTPVEGEEDDIQPEDS
jgi:hypothetical protein